jgi:hypothetical protein
MQQVEIRVKGCINQQWSEWFSGLAINYSDSDETILTGLIPDEAALYGIISRVRDLGLKLTSLSSEEVQENHHERAK